MSFIACTVGVIGACALIGGSLVYVFAPAATQRFLKTVAVSLGMLIFLLFIARELTHAAHPFGIFLATMGISLAAHFIRAHRHRRPERPKRLRGVERTPVMPRQVPGDEL